MHIEAFLRNRISFPHSELVRHLGRWVAFDEHGLSILAAADTLDRLEAALAENRIDPQTVHLEYIPGSGEDDGLTSPESAHEVSVSK